MEDTSCFFIYPSSLAQHGTNFKTKKLPLRKDSFVLILSRLDKSSDRQDRHHIDTSVTDLITGVGSMYYLAASDVDTYVSAVASAGIPAYYITYGDVFTRNIYTT